LRAVGRARGSATELLHPQPSTLNPKPQPSSLNPKPQASSLSFNPQPSTQSSTLHGSAALHYSCIFRALEEVLSTHCYLQQNTLPLPLPLPLPVPVPPLSLTHLFCHTTKLRKDIAFSLLYSPMPAPNTPTAPHMASYPTCNRCTREWSALLASLRNRLGRRGEASAHPTQPGGEWRPRATEQGARAYLPMQKSRKTTSSISSMSTAP